MNQETKKCLSPWIAWAIVLLVAGAAGFAVWYYWNQVDSISDFSVTVTTKTTPGTTKTKTANDTIQANTPDSTELVKLCLSENAEIISNPGFVCKVTKVEGNYAHGTFSDDTGGANWYAKKINSVWSIIINGSQDDPSCAKTVGFPKTIVPECAQ